MPPFAEEDEKESRAVAWVTVVALVAGALLVAVSSAGVESEALFVIDRLVRFDTTWRARELSVVPVLTTRGIFQLLLIVGLSVVFAAILGIVGAKTRHKSLVCTYVVLAFAFTVVMVLGAIQTLQRKSAIEPMVDREVHDICNSTTYIRLSRTIPCEWASIYAPSEVTPCGAICQWRADLLRNLEGCEILPKLCKHFFYEELLSVNCATAISQDRSMMYGASESNDHCRQLCDQDIRCTAYAYSGASVAKPQRCLLGAGVAAVHLPPEWAPVTPSEAREYLSGGSGIRCYRRTEPCVLQQFRRHGTRLAASTILLSIALAASTLCSCCLMYNVNVRKHTLPSAAELGLLMCCPCCAGDIRQRLFEPTFSDEVTEEDEEDDEMDKSDSGSLVSAGHRMCS